MKLASLFSDRAILQRETPIPVWGWTRPGAKVSASLGGNEAQGLAGADGKFFLRLPSMKAGGPYELSVKTLDGAPESASAKDVWIGEVWLASGQSNMEWTVSQLGNDAEAMELGACKSIRMVKIPNTTFAGRQSDVNATWEEANPDSISSFSAIGAHFAKCLAESLGVKVGVINSSWGGTIIEAWISRETLVRNPEQADRIARYEADVFSKAYWNARDGQEPGEPSPLPADPGNKGLESGWASPSCDDSAWNAMKLPGAWTSQGHKHSGVLWFRKSVQIPAAWAGKDLELGIGAVDKHDITYFNGEQVGATGAGFDESVWNKTRVYKIPGRLVKAGSCVVAVRAYSFIYDGGLIGPASRMRLSLEGSKEGAISLQGEWRYAVERNFGVVQPPPKKPGPGEPNSPYMLFDNMIAPLAPYALRGAIWYQGESNTDKPMEYERLLKDMVRDWRFAWGQSSFSFYNVQLANFGAGPDRDWPRVREAQTKLLSEPETGVAVAIDIGESIDIHPKNKREVGRRLSLWALADIHGKHVAKSGPLFKSVSIEGSKLRVRFSHSCGGLVAKGGELKCFQIAGEARCFVPAEAAIDGEELLVSSPEVKAPVAVRYAWSNDPEGANLSNKAGLPASPFRSDAWTV